MADSKLRKWWRRKCFDDDVAVPKVAARGAPGATTENFESAHAYVDGAGKVFPGADYGIALSGGGIRSASFCKGVLQALAGGRHALEAAMAISGAAVASAMGARTRVPALGRLAVLLNLRLGVWLPNPRATVNWPDESRPKGRWIRRRRGSWLIREVLGVFPSARRFVYVSDGGHLDNLGMLELLRRRCRTILVVDASGDPLRTTATFDEVLELATSHLGIKVIDDGELAALRDPGNFAGLPPDRVSEKCVAVINFRYPELVGATGCEGTIVLAKATFAQELTGNPEAERAASRVRADWRPRLWAWSARTVPRTSTFNQLLTGDVFDAYVELGRAIGNRAVARMDSKGDDGVLELAAVVSS